MYSPDKLFTDTTPKTFTPDLRGLVAWLETQNPETVYCADHPSHCLVANFLGRQASVDPDCDVRGSKRVAFDKPWTYGAALSRAKRAAGITKWWEFWK